jgi:hypothetical protein
VGSFSVLLTSEASGEISEGVRSEELPRVMYRLIEADHYINEKILVVGGGNSFSQTSVAVVHPTQ